MTTNAAIGYGSVFEVSTDNGSSWDEIGEVFTITPPSDEIDTPDVTHMASPNATREFILGLSDPGECSLEINFLPGSASEAIILAIRAARLQIKARITFPNAVIWTFDCILRSYQPAVPLDDKMTATVAFKVSGMPVVTPAAAPVNLVLPAISGTVKEGETLTAWPGIWSGAPTYAYAWKNEGVAIDGATGQTYVPVAGDVGDALSVTVTGTNAAGSASATSAETTDVAAEG